MTDRSDRGETLRVDEHDGSSMAAPCAHEGSVCRPSTHRRRNAVVFALVTVAWVVFDYVTKRLLDGPHAPGDSIAGPFLGLFRLRLIHNTGAAWGMFGDATTVLAFLSLAVCIALAVYLFVFAPQANLGQAIGLSLVVAGGIGNALDRFMQGYVVDFIDLTFMDFPVFNVADIGVTCGFIIFVLSLMIAWNHEGRAISPGEEPSGEEGSKN